MEVVAPVIEDVYPLSPPQLAVFNEVQENPGRIPNHQLVHHVKRMEAGIFESAWQRLVDHHSIFRTSIQWEGLERPVQVVQGNVKFSLEQQDWSHLPVQDYRESLEKFLEDDRLRGFALDHPPLMRVSLIQLAEGASLFIWSYHPLILDPWSASLALADLYLLYDAIFREKVLLLMPAPRYREYISWLRMQDSRPAEDFWRRLLSDLAGTTPLPLSRRNSDGGFQEDRLTVGLKLTDKLRNFAARHSVKVSTLVRGAWAIVLGCHSGSNDVVFGDVVSGRPASISGIQRTVGLFINVLPMRVRMSARNDLLSWLRSLEEQEVQQRPFQHNLVNQIIAWSSLPPDNPLFESVLNLQKRPSSIETHLSARAGRLQSQAVQAGRVAPSHPLEITVAPSAKSGLILKATTLHCRFEPGVGAHLLRDLRTAMARLVARPRPGLEDLHRVVSPLIPIQTQGSSAPIFFVHPTGGSVAGYYQLAEAMGVDQPFFAFEARGSQKRHHIRIEALAAYYLAALRRAYPNGPYQLGGWSFGALVAFEMARQLQQQGQQVTQVAMLDPPLVFNAKQESPNTTNSSLLIRFARSLGYSIRESTLARVPERRQFAFLLQRLKKAGLKLPQTTVGEFQRHVQIFLYHLEAVKSYAPQSYPGRVALFMAEKRKDTPESVLGGDWNVLTPNLEVHRVPGSHQTMMRQPHLTVLAEHLRQAFRK